MQIRKETFSIDFIPEEHLKIIDPALPDKLLFYDIETTGLSSSRNEVYLIGFAARSEEGFEYTALLSENSGEEAEILTAFNKIANKYPLLIEYNGSTFDHPFLVKRCTNASLPTFAPKKELDLYREFSFLKRYTNIESLKQKDLEALLGIERRFPDGKECIRLYRAWQRDHDEIKKKMFIGHNKEDLTGLVSICRIASVLQLYKGMYACISASLTENKVIFKLGLPLPLPFRLDFSNGLLIVQGEEQEAEIQIYMKDGRLRQFYPDYKNYDYLPSEDTAMTKSVSAFLDRSLKKPARPETCYTWFRPGPEFIETPAIQEKYLRQTLPLMLDL